MGDYELTYYEKTVPITEISGLFSVLFKVFIGELSFSIDDVRENNNIVVLCFNMDYANEHGFSELERGVWIAEKPIESFDKFQFIKSKIDSEEKTILSIDKDQLVYLWQKYEYEVSISAGFTKENK